MPPHIVDYVTVHSDHRFGYESVVADPLAQQRIAQLEAVLAERTAHLIHAQTELNSLAASKPYKLLKFMNRVVDRLLPLSSRRRSAMKWIARKLVGAPRRLLRGKPPRPGHIFADRFDLVYTPEEEYRLWQAKVEPTAEELAAQRAAHFKHTPLFSVVVPVFNPPAEYLRAMIESVRGQTYIHWELCLADASTAGHVRPILEEYAAADSRIRVKFLEQNLGIVGNSNAAIELAQGEFVALLDHDDTLAPFALYAMAAAVNEQPEADFLYSDEDKLDPQGRRVVPFFKPGWSPDTLRTHNYICHLAVLRRDVLVRIGGFRDGYDGSQDHDLLLRMGEVARAVVHVPQILYHWRMHANSTAANPDSKSYAYEAGRRAVVDHLQRLGLEADVFHGETVGYFKPVYRVPRQPLVSVIVPSRDHPQLLRGCVDAVRKSGHANFELLIVRNGQTSAEAETLYEELGEDPRIAVLRWRREFNFSQVNNFGAAHARGEYLLLLNNDVLLKKSDWLEVLVRYAMQPGVGAVGPKLLYEDGTIQHAGIALGLGGIAGHPCLHFPDDAKGYMGRLLYPQNVTAVTGACLLTPRELYLKVGGLDEGYSLAYNDVDYCLKIRDLGYRVIWTPESELVHLESKTRGYETNPEKLERLQREGALFQRKWLAALEAGDLYFNRHFRRDRPDFALNII